MPSDRRDPHRIPRPRRGGALAAAACGLALLAGAAARAAPDPDPARWEKPALRFAAAPEDSVRPPADDRGFDVQRYELDLALDVPDRSLAGRVAVLLDAVRPALARIRLDLVAEMTVDEVLWQGSDLAAPPAPAAFAHDGDSLVVELPAPLAAGRRGRLEVAWHGRPPRHGPLNSGLMFRTYTVDLANPDESRPIVASVSQPWSAHSWWPCKDHPSDKATARIAVEADEALTVVSNGVLVEESPVGPGRRRTVWEEGHPIATYLVSLAVSDYVSWEESCPGADGPVRLAYHAFPPDRERMATDTARTCEMLHFLEELFGPYPFTDEKYAQAEFAWVGAMENQTATSLARFMFTGDGRYEHFVVHEFAHQWCGDHVTPATWPDIWLNEGFARYSEALWKEHRDGREAYLAYLRLRGPEQHPDLFTGEAPLTDPDPILPNLVIYDKGAWVLHMLRAWLGDDRFFAAVRAYVTDPRWAGGNVDTEGFLNAVSAAAGEDLRPVLEPWLDTSAVPELRTRVAISGGPGAAARTVELQVGQEQPTAFRFVLPVHIHTAGGTRVERAVVDGRRRVFRWLVPAAVDSVRLDPEGWLLYRDRLAPEPLLSLLAAQPNPAGPGGATLSFRVARPARVRCALYDARGRRRGQWDLGERITAGEDPEQWLWDGRDGAGRPLPSGVYWLELRAAGLRAVRKITLLH